MHMNTVAYAHTHTHTNTYTCTHANMHTNIHTRAHKHTCMSALLLHKHSYDSSKHSEHHAFMLFMESLPAAACLKDVPCEVGLGQGKGRPTGADPYSFGCRR